MTGPATEVMQYRVGDGTRTVLVTRTETTTDGVTADAWVLSYNDTTVASFTDPDAATAAAGDYVTALAEADDLRAQADTLEADAMTTMTAKPQPEPLPVPPEPVVSE